MSDPIGALTIPASARLRAGDLIRILGPGSWELAHEPFPSVRLPGGPYGFPPMDTAVELDGRTADFDDVTAAQYAMVDDLRTQAAMLGLDLADFELTVERLEPDAADFTANRVRFRAEATLRRKDTP